jgi:hypothetical protein
MTWQDDQKRVATGVTDGTDGRKYSTVFPYEPWPVQYICRFRMGQNGVTWYDGKGNVTMHIDSQNGVTVSKRVEDDDDIQDYKRPWVGLTNNELQPICDEYRIIFGSWAEDFARAIEAKLKEKNT